MAATAERRGSIANIRRASQAIFDNEPRRGSMANIRRASEGFTLPPGAGGSRRSLGGSSVRKGDSVKEEADEEHGVGEIEGEDKFHKLGWMKLTVCLIVEAIALGSLSIPAAFATLGMVPGVIMSVGLGCIAIYTSYVVGQVRMKVIAPSH